MYDRSAVLDAAGRVTGETVVQRQGADTLRSVTSFGYGSAGYALGQAVSASVARYRIVSGQDQYQGMTATANGYDWAAGPRLASSTTVTTPSSGAQTRADARYAYGAGNRLETVALADGRARTVSFVNDFNGQAIRRDEADALASGDPHERWWRFGGLELGHVGNNTGQPADYAISIAQRGQAPSNQPFGTVDPRYDGDFTQALDPITSFDQGAPGGTHVVQPGDSLASIAAAVWGDASLWYKLAQANGLGGDAMLAPGQVLTIPVGVVRSTYNGATFSPFDPQQTLGDVSPVQPTPTAARKKNNKCGAFGQVLLVVVAVAVAVVTQGALVSALGPVLGGAAVGVAGSVASQGLGLATGIQDEFSFKGVALAAIAGGVGGALQGVDAFGKASGLAQLGSDAVRGAIGNALTQGVAVATGLQNRFDWAGVAVGGVAGAVGRGVGRQLQRAGVTGFGNGLAAGVAAGAAGAAARSLATGTSFGDNLLAVLPDVIGSTIGNAVGERLAGGGRSSSMSPAEKALVAQAERSASGTNRIAGGRIAGADPGRQAANGVSGGTEAAISGYDSRSGNAVVWSNEEGGITIRANERYQAALGGYDFGAFASRPFDLSSVTPRAGPSITLAQLDQMEASPFAAIGFGIADMLGADPRRTAAAINLGEASNGILLGLGGMRGVGQPYLGNQIGIRAAEEALSGTALARRLGIEGEQAIGITGPKAGIRILGSNQLRFPDAINVRTGTLIESKNVAYQGYTRQLRDYAAYAQDKGFTFELYVRGASNPLGQTRLSGPLEAAVRRGEIVLKPIPGR